MPQTPKKHALLLIENFDKMRNILGRQCAENGYEVAATGSLESALTLAKNEHPDVIIFDFNMKMMHDPYVAVSLLHNALPKGEIIILYRGELGLIEKLRSLGASSIIHPKNIETELNRKLHHNTTGDLMC
ncbi:MAG TPA: response regulator [Candidatus Kapabacteria bacterium]|nr:response regulator [Candidatus Kapabacteria bacterium]